MEKFLKGFEKAVVYALICMMVLVVAFATVGLGWTIIKDLGAPPILLLSPEHLLDIAGGFLLVLIGVELLETIKAYLKEHVVHVEVVLEVALIAVARKVIILEVKEYEGIKIFAIAALILVLAVAFLLEKLGRLAPLGFRQPNPPPPPPVAD